jgi:hypothetical protein
MKKTMIPITYIHKNKHYDKTMEDAIALNPNNLTFAKPQLYLISTSLLLANLLAPAITHQFGQAGQMLLPIYACSLLAGLAFGWRCGFLVGLFTPLVSFWFSHMPPISLLPFILLKSVILGSISGILIRQLSYHHTFLIAGITLLLMQFIGDTYIYLATHQLRLALLDITIGYPGLLLQLIAIPLLSQKVVRLCKPKASPK